MSDLSIKQEENVSGRNRDYKSMANLSSEFNKIQDLDILLERILLEARRVVNADAGSIYVKRRVYRNGIWSNELLIQYAQNDTLSKSANPNEKAIFTLQEDEIFVPINDESVAGYCAFVQDIINIPDMYQIPPTASYSFNPAIDELTGYKTVSTLTFPLTTAEGELLGVIQLINAIGENGDIVPFNASNEFIITRFAATASAAINTYLKMAEYIRELKLFGVTDQLTKLPNRRSFDDRIKAEFASAIRKKEPLSVLVIDVDNFKKYNDTYGHLQGDVLLTTIAEVFTNSVVRATDFVSRWGGEEFVILLPNTDSAGAVGIAERVRMNIKETVIRLPDGTLTSTTISIGVNTEIPKADTTIEAFLEKADQMVYAAKKAGKDRVCAC